MIVSKITDSLKLLVVSQISRDMVTAVEKLKNIQVDPKLRNHLVNLQSTNLIEDVLLDEECTSLLVGDTKKGIFKLFGSDSKCRNQLELFLANSAPFQGALEKDSADFYTVCNGQFCYFHKDGPKIVVYSSENESNPFEEIDNILVQIEKINFEL